MLFITFCSTDMVCKLLSADSCAFTKRPASRKPPPHLPRRLRGNYPSLSQLEQAQHLLYVVKSSPRVFSAL